MTKLCLWCNANHTMSDKSSYCTFCYENNNLYDWFYVFNRIIATTHLNENMENVELYRVVLLINERMCENNLFNKIAGQIKKVSSYQLAVNILKTVFNDNNGLFFTAEQCKELIKNKFIDDNDKFKWHNLLVYMCPEFYKLSVDDFTCGICYFGNLGEQFGSLFKYIKYMAETRNYTSSMRTEFF